MLIRYQLQRLTRVALVGAVAILGATPATADVIFEQGPAVPEPTAALVFGAGALALGFALRGRKR